MQNDREGNYFAEGSAVIQQMNRDMMEMLRNGREP